MFFPQVEFIVEYRPEKEPEAGKPVNFTVSPESLENVKERAKVPRFHVQGHLDSASCSITKVGLFVCLFVIHPLLLDASSVHQQCKKKKKIKTRAILVETSKVLKK